MSRRPTIQEQLWQQEAIGRERLEIEKETGGGTFERVIPKRPVGEALSAQIANAGGIDKLLVLYYEHFRRSKHLVAYMDDNVGIGDQWPIYIEGDSIQGEDRLKDMLTELRNAGNYLEELSEMVPPTPKG